MNNQQEYKLNDGAKTIKCNQTRNLKQRWKKTTSFS